MERGDPPPVMRPASLSTGNSAPRRPPLELLFVELHEDPPPKEPILVG